MSETMKENKNTFFTITRNGSVVMAEPFPSYSVEKQDKGGFVVLSQKEGKLTKLKVLADLYFHNSPPIRSGSFIYVMADQFKALWAKPLKVGEVSCIFVPLDQICVVEEVR